MNGNSQRPETLTSEPAMPDPYKVEVRRTPLPVCSRPLSPDWFFHLVLSGLALVFVLVSVIGLRLAGWRMSLAALAVRAVPPALFLLGIVFYRWRRERRIVSLLGVVFWSLTFGILYLAPM